MIRVYGSWPELVDEEVKKAIEKDRAATIKRLRQFSEEKTRFAADTLQNDWFYGEKK